MEGVGGVDGGGRDVFVAAAVGGHEQGTAGQDFGSRFRPHCWVSECVSWWGDGQRLLLLDAADSQERVILG